MILLAGLGIIGYLVFQPKPAPVPTTVRGPLPKAEGHVMGSDSAPVEIVEYGDFECPICGQFATVTEPDVRTRIVNTGLARFRYVDFPLEAHPNSLFAHNAAYCAGAQGKFWEMHDRIYEGQPEWSGLETAKVPNAAKIMKQYARGLALDTKAFNTCLDSRQFEPQIEANRAQGLALRVDGTPTFFIGNQMIRSGLIPYDELKKIVDSVAAAARKAPAAAKPRKDSGGT